MGVLMDLYGMELLNDVKKGCCQECGVRHSPEQPHNKDSLYYQYHFYNEHGRWPTWADAMAHCSPEVKEFWKKELEGRGIEV